MKRSGWLFPAATAVACLAAALIAAPAGTMAEQPAVTDIAVFPFEINVERQMGMSYGDDKASPDEAARLDKMTTQLRELLAASGLYNIVPLDSVAAELQSAQPLYKCNGCDADLAAKAGAQQAVSGTVQKASDTLMNISIFVRDAKTGEVVKSMAVSVRQNSDAAWLRGVRWLVKNRFLPAQSSMGQQKDRV